MQSLLLTWKALSKGKQISTSDEENVKKQPYTLLFHIVFSQLNDWCCISWRLRLLTRLVYTVGGITEMFPQITDEGQTDQNTVTE